MKLNELLQQITPGKFNYGYLRGCFRLVSGKTTIAWVDFWQDPECRELKPDKEQEANAAYLTHSANVLPELVEALKKITDAYADAMKNAGVTRYPETLFVVREARQALTKAENIN